MGTRFGLRSKVRIWAQYAGVELEVGVGIGVLVWVENEVGVTVGALVKVGFMVGFVSGMVLGLGLWLRLR